MPQAIERLLATPMISPRLPRISPEDSAIDCPAARQYRLPPYGIGSWGHQAKAPLGRRSSQIQFISGNMILIAGLFITAGPAFAREGGVRFDQRGPAWPRLRKTSRRQSRLCGAMPGR